MALRRLYPLLASHSRRLSSKITDFRLQTIVSQDDCVNLKINDKDKELTLLVPLVWLRDHCSSSKCYHAPTNQRKSSMINLFEEAKIKEIRIENQNGLLINWTDGHQSSFKIEDILRRTKKGKPPRVTKYINMWDGRLAEIPSIHHGDLTQENFSKNLFKYGVVVINGIESTAEATETLCKQLIPVHDTFFGQFWTFSNEANENEPVYEDTAYGNEEIGPHTDGTYFNQTPGIQVFHCLKPAKNGGETILVDSFHCASILKESDPESFEVLASTKIEHHYLEGTPSGSVLNTVSHEKPVIELDSYRNITQIRYNPYDRAPYRCLGKEEDAREAIRFYKAYEKFSRICHDPSNSVQISLQPGSVIFIDNFRVLHSRAEFQGHRQMCGCYLSRDNFYAKARPFLPEEIRRYV